MKKNGLLSSYKIKIEPNKYYNFNCKYDNKENTRNIYLKYSDEKGKELKIVKSPGISPENSKYVQVFIEQLSDEIIEGSKITEAILNIGKETKPYIDYIQKGIQEFTISDNPFAFSMNTREKLLPGIWKKMRGKSMCGFDITNIPTPYLDAGDLIVVKSNGEEYITPIGSRAIEYKGILREKNSLEVKSNTETKYAFTSTMKNAMKNVEILVNKAENNITMVVEEQKKFDGKLNELKFDIDGINLKFKKFGTMNLIRNSAMKADKKYWLSNLNINYIESDIPPADIKEGEYWICSNNYGNYEKGRVYRKKDGILVLTNLTKKYLVSSNQLLENVSSYENDYTRKVTISKRLIKEYMPNDFSKTHNFICTNEIDLSESEKDLFLSFKLKNALKTGIVQIGIIYLNDYIKNINIEENIYSMFEETVIFTPDDCKELTNINIHSKIPKLEDLLEVKVSNEEPIEKNVLWLDTNIFLIKEYKDGEWRVKATRNTCYDKATDDIWTFRPMINAYYKTPVKRKDYNIRTAFAIFTIYPSFYFMETNSAPAVLPKGYYYGNRNTNIMRAKYDGDNFVEFEDTGIPTAFILDNPLPSPPFPTKYGIPAIGEMEFGDVMLTYSKTKIDWSPYPEEIYGKNFRADEDGLLIESGQNTMFIDEDEIIAKFNGENIFFLNKQYGFMNYLQTNRIEILANKNPGLYSNFGSNTYIIEQKNNKLFLY